MARGGEEEKEVAFWFVKENGAGVRSARTSKPPGSRIDSFSGLSLLADLKPPVAAGGTDLIV